MSQIKSLKDLPTTTTTTTATTTAATATTTATATQKPFTGVGRILSTGEKEESSQEIAKTSKGDMSTVTTVPQQASEWTGESNMNDRKYALYKTIASPCSTTTCDEETPSTRGPSEQNEEEDGSSSSTPLNTNANATTQSSLQVVTEERKLTSLKKREKEELAAYLDKSGSYLRNWKHLVDVLYDDIPQSERNKIKDSIEPQRFGGGVAGSFLLNLSNRRPDLTIGEFRADCKKFHRNDIAYGILKDYRTDQLLAKDLDQVHMEELKIKLDADEFWIELAEETFDFDPKTINNIKTKPSAGNVKPKTCTECLLDRLGGDKTDMTVQQLAKYCGTAGINDAKKYLESLL